MQKGGIDTLRISVAEQQQHMDRTCYSEFRESRESVELSHVDEYGQQVLL